MEIIHENIEISHFLCYTFLMSNQNICKFILPKEQNDLTALNFVYEQNEANCGKTMTLPNHAIYLVTEGAGLLSCVQTTHSLQKGTLFFTFANQPFSIRNTKELKHYYITFTGGRAEELFRRFGVTPTSAAFQGYESLLPLWQESLFRADEQTLDLLAESVLLYSFSKLKKAEKNTDLIGSILTYLEQHFTDPALSLAEVADALGYNPKYLSSLFKREIGNGFAQYLRLMRIRHAVLLIENGVTSIKNVACLCGFSDPLYFSKVFREAVGVSPKDFKKTKSAE